MGSFSLWHWLILLVVVVVIFGTKKLSSAGTDVGSAIKNFKKAMKDGEAEGTDATRQIKQSMKLDADFPESKSDSKSSDSDRKV